jgi:hypothetical protein
MLRLVKCSKCLLKKNSRLLSSSTVHAPEAPELVRFGQLRKSPYEHGHHRSNAEQLINKVPVILVDGYEAVCDGTIIKNKYLQSLSKIQYLLYYNTNINSFY